jgi:dienelactone hydrolase
LCTPQPTGDDLLPCVVMGHGAGGTMANLLPIAERLAAAGMAALAFDYRYFGERGGQPRQLMHTEWQREDWRAAVRLARACPRIDPERIAPWGTSFSGGHVVADAAGDPRIAAVVAQVPLIDAWRGGPSVRRPLREVLGLFAACSRPPSWTPSAAGSDGHPTRCRCTARPVRRPSSPIPT